MVENSRKELDGDQKLHDNVAARAVPGRADSEKVAGPQVEPGVSYHLPDLDLPSPLWAALRLDGPVPGRLQTCPSR